MALCGMRLVRRTKPKSRKAQTRVSSQAISWRPPFRLRDAMRSGDVENRINDLPQLHQVLSSTVTNEIRLRAQDTPSFVTLSISLGLRLTKFEVSSQPASSNAECWQNGTVYFRFSERRAPRLGFWSGHIHVVTIRSSLGQGSQPKCPCPTSLTGTG